MACSSIARSVLKFARETRDWLSPTILSVTSLIGPQGTGWYRQPIQDGSISTPDSTKDSALEAADTAAREKAEEYDMRPKEEPEAAEEPEKRPERKSKDKS